MKKIFLSPFFTPVWFLVLWGALLTIVLIWFPEQKFIITEDGHILDIITYTGYGLMLASMLYFFRDFKTKEQRTSWTVFFVLGICALLREAGIQHHLASVDTTPFKSRFFTNPMNPIHEKIIFGLVLIIVFGMVAYLVIKYTKHLITSFFKMNTVTWSTAVLCCDLVFAKFADRYPSNYRHSHPAPLPREAIEIWSLLEESSEVFLPLLAIIILWQYHLIKNAENK